MRIALVTEVFFEDPDGAALRAHLTEAVAGGAGLAVLPELPMNAWAPYSKTARDEDAEEFDGPRQRAMASAAAAAGIALLGGAIVRDADGTRHNTAVLYDAQGMRVASYCKVHLPEEEGYWETSHYDPGTEPPEVIGGFELALGLQICSDVNRPQGFQLLAAQGAQVVLAPRATPPDTYARWRMVLRANAVMSGTYVVSVNRPRPEATTEIGGASLAIAPDGTVLCETTEPVAVVDLSREVWEATARDYPGYLRRFADLYASGWGRIAGT